MAEWIGPRHRRYDSTAAADWRPLGEDEPAETPPAPGSVSSPQHPGEVPDRSTVPGQFVTRVPRATSVRRPLTEYGTAQRIMNVYAAPPGKESDPSRFEQATAAYEELRKAYPAQLPPVRPAPGYALQHGDETASELQEIDAGPVPLAAATTTGGAGGARPAGGTTS